MHDIKIGVVEDERIVSEVLILLLNSMGYNNIVKCGNYDDAIRMLENDKPDLMLIDITLVNSKSGIEVARYIREQELGVPFIFLTSSADKETLDKAKEVQPHGYLVKPARKPDMYAAIEIAMHNSARALKLLEEEPPVTAEVYNDSLFIKDGQQLSRISTADILYINSDHVYVTVYTSQRKYVLRGSLQQYLEKLDPQKFIRVHRSYVVNLAKVEKLGTTFLIIQELQIPVSKNHRDILLEKLNIN